ncbi:MAG: hypothetical protein ACE363_07665 [Alphaproteobacteria bacterium]
MAATPLLKPLVPVVLMLPSLLACSADSTDDRMVDACIQAGSAIDAGIGMASIDYREVFYKEVIVGLSTPSQDPLAESLKLKCKVTRDRNLRRLRINNQWVSNGELAAAQSAFTRTLEGL